MIIALLSGIIIGFILAIPPGPVAVTALRISLEQGLKNGIFAALGTGFMDFVYCLVVIFATSAVLALVNNFFIDYPIVFLVFQVLVVVSVIIYGVINLKLKDRIVNPKKKRDPGKFKYLDGLSKRGPFLLGIAVALANAANPTFLPALAYITVNAQKFILHENNALENIVFAFAFGLGNFLWLYAISRILLHYQDKMSKNTIARIHQFAGVTLIGFGTILGYRVITLTHWPEILRLFFAF
jgi:threonine/homoserine/homoserine lactone efflux protein